ncbi:MAG: hypothetical protein ACJAS4_002899 [Bacteriovoracaceae bacterium]|jgi:hypothetical protein
MKNWGRFLFTLTSTFISLASFAGSLSIPIIDAEFIKRPPADLIYHEKNIDSYEAFELQRQGIDLSELDPYESHLWQNQKHPLAQEVSEKTVFNFSSYKASPTEFFRSVVTGKDGERFVLTASLDNHTNIIRGNILRKLGYNITTPQFKKKIYLNFLNESEKIDFLEKLGEQTLTNRNRWIETNTNPLQLTLKDLTIEPAQLDNVNIFLPVMSKARQEERRVFRSLLAIYVLTDFSQSVNSIDWKVGRNFNNYLSFSHTYATAFSDTSIDDLKWIYKRLNKLSTVEIKQIVSHMTGYPSDIASLISEKLKSRINSLGQHLSIDKKLKFNRSLTIGNIKDGKLLKDAYPSHVVNYFKEEADSPYEFDELFKLFRTQSTYSALSKVLDNAIDKFVPGISINDASSNIQQRIKDYKIENKNSNGNIPLKVFTYPTANVSTSLRRNIVFGNHMGNVAPIQLVDSVSADANLGVYSMVTGLNSTVLPSVSASVALSRTYTHVRAMPDLNSATSQSIKKALVPKLLKSIGAVIKNEFTCSLVGDVNVVESEINGKEIIYIKYDQDITGAKERAISKRKDLISSGTSEDIILLVPINTLAACSDEVTKEKDKNLNSFLKEFALNETFIISDSINLIGTANANIPLNTYLNQQMSLSLGADLTKGFLKSVTLRKKDDHIEISIQRQSNKSNALSLGLNYFIEILKGTTKWLKGEQETYIYKVVTEGIDENQKDIVLKTLRELFVSNKTIHLDENFDYITLEHQMNSQLNTLQSLWFKSDYLQMDHFVDILLPQNQYPSLSKEERTKTLFSTSSIRRNGQDYIALVNSLLNRVNQFLSFGQSASDPGQTLKGSSKSRYYVTESDISKNTDQLITTKVDYIWKGWSANYSKLDQMFNFIENLYGKTMLNYKINRDLFKNQGLLKGYEVKSTLIVYPEFISKIEDHIFSKSEKEALKKLKELFGEKDWTQYCLKKNRTQNRNIRRRKCTPTAVITILNFKRDGIPTSKVEKAKAYNSILIALLEGFNRSNIINWIGKENFFASTRVTGFLESSEKGYIDHISNTYGHYNTKYGTGVFDKLSSLLGITPYELRALNYTPGM